MLAVEDSDYAREARRRLHCYTDVEGFIVLDRYGITLSPREAELSRDHQKMLAGIRKYACADWMASA